MGLALFSYRRGNSVLHKMNAGAKIIFLFAFSVFVFWGRTPDTAEEIFSRAVLLKLAACFAVCALLFVLSGARLKSLLKLRFVFVIGAMVALLKMFGSPRDGAAYGFLYTARFFISALAAQCVFETTTAVQIQSALRLPLAVSLAIHFIPEIFSEWEKIKLAARSRTFRANEKNPAAIVALVFYELQALFFCMLQKAETTRRAVQNRSVPEAKK